MYMNNDIVHMHDEVIRPRDPQTNTIQHNATHPRQSFFKEKRAALDGTQTGNILCSRQMSYQLSYRGSSAGWVKSHIQSNTT